MYAEVGCANPTRGAQMGILGLVHQSTIFERYVLIKQLDISANVLIQAAGLEAKTVVAN